MEREVVVLKTVWDLIDEMVNYELFAAMTTRTDVTLMFNGTTHQRLFNILLVDFLLSQIHSSSGLRNRLIALRDPSAAYYLILGKCVLARSSGLTSPASSRRSMLALAPAGPLPERSDLFRRKGDH
ncbi:MAG: hypothetical protein ABJC09_10290 [Terriglobia bacterium]